MLTKEEVLKIIAQAEKNYFHERQMVSATDGRVYNDSGLDASAFYDDINTALSAEDSAPIEEQKRGWIEEEVTRQLEEEFPESIEDFLEDKIRRENKKIDLYDEADIKKVGYVDIRYEGTLCAYDENGNEIEESHTIEVSVEEYTYAEDAHYRLVY